MAHWAEVDENNTVLRVVTTSNDDTNEGYDWLVENLSGTWIKTSYNTCGGEHLEGGTPFRKNFAAIGYVYDADRDAFIPPKKYESWTLNEETCLWEPPVDYPEDGQRYLWNEGTQSWELVEP